MLEPPNSKRLAQQLYEQLFDLILRGEMKPGSKLASERKMAADLGISRTTVREAVRKLVEKGVAENRQGSGTFVKACPPADETHPLMAPLAGKYPTLSEIIEVRAPLEVNGAKLAAQRATEKDVALLEQSLARMRANMDPGPANVDEDVCFHMNISYATNNVAYINLMRSFQDVMHYGMHRLFDRIYLRRESTRQQYEQHESIFQGIKNRDPDEASQAMARHLVELARQLADWEAELKAAEPVR